jgi:ATP-dependent DNA helicase DinG
VLSDDLKKTIQTAYSQLLENKNLKPRYSQRLMIADIARTLGNIDKEKPDTPHICTLEAGTGTGKTIAYVVAALPIARQLKKKLIISTATIALQEQILLKDLPDIQRHSGLNFSFTLAKGRRRYVCLHNLNQFVSAQSQPGLPLLPSDYQENLLNNKDDGELYQTLFQAFNSKQWNGELDSWPDTINSSSWQPLTADQHQCSGKRCSFYEQCVYFKARESIFKVDCIVANHDLVLSDLNMGGGFILPPPDECIYIFDEGHHLPDKAINHFYFSFKTQSTIKWLEQLNATLNSFSDLVKPPEFLSKLIKKTPELTAEINRSITQLNQLLLQFDFQASGFNGAFNKERPLIYRFESGQVPEQLKHHCQSLLALLINLFGVIENINSKLKETIDGEITGLKSESAEQWLPVIAPMQNRIEAMLALLESYTVEDKPDKPPHARWIKKEIQDDRDFTLSSSPILAANALEQILWTQCYAAVVTSATIAALGDFNRYILNSGVSGTFNIFPSPFNYQEHADFFVPKMRSDAGNNLAHTDELCEILPQLINEQEGTLVLFASKKQLEDVEYELLRSDSKWKKLLLTQGQKNKQALIESHKKQIDKGHGSVIFGLASFAEGIDLPGQYCKHVIIAKLPFAVPNDPVDASLHEWLQSQGRNPFMEVTIPDAAIKLVQACGRLIRKEDDSGRITLLDKRIITKRYGQQILNALPPFKQHLNVEIAQVY